MAMPSEEILERTDRLFQLWCDQRNARALRELLRGYPLSSGLTDDWGGLLGALEGVRAFARDNLSDAEAHDVDELISAIGVLLSGH